MKSKPFYPSEKNVDEFKLLSEMLKSQKIEFDLLSKKKADGALNKMKIKMTNRVLEPLKSLLTNEESHNFLDILDEENLPTNSDVVLILSQYEAAISKFTERYFRQDKGSYSKRWFTQENPPSK